MNVSPSIQKLFDELERLPGIGSKSAQRIAYWMIDNDTHVVLRLSDAIKEVKENIHFCKRCFNYAEEEYCAVCQAHNREEHKLCVVSEPRDIIAIERTGMYAGLYHVLGGELSPMEGIGPEQLHINELSKRIADEHIEEIILALNPSIEGETTAAFLLRTLNHFDIVISKLASGVPVGGDLEFIDERTLGRAIELRTEC